MALFVKGQSGNKAGRPKGIEDRRTSLKKAYEKDGSKVIEVVIAAALDGDLTACKLILDRLTPPLRARSEPVVFDLDQNGDLTEIAKSILKSVSEGKVPADVGNTLIASLSGVSKIQEVTDLAARIDYLEATLQ